MDLENNKKEVQKDTENLDNKKPLEVQESFESIEGRFKGEILRDQEEFKQKDEQVDKIEKSVGVSNPDDILDVKKDLNLVGGLADLNNQFDELKSKTEEYIEWLKLDNHKFDENSFYRVVDERGYKDFQETGIVRSSPNGTDSYIVKGIDIGHRPTSFPSFDKGAPDLSYAKDGVDNYIFESNIDMYRSGEKNPVTQRPIKGRHWAYRPIDQTTGNIIKEMTPEQIKNVYKVDKEGNTYIKNYSSVAKRDINEIEQNTKQLELSARIESVKGLMSSVRGSIGAEINKDEVENQRNTIQGKLLALLPKVSDEVATDLQKEYLIFLEEINRNALFSKEEITQFKIVQPEVNEKKTDENKLDANPRGLVIGEDSKTEEKKQDVFEAAGLSFSEADIENIVSSRIKYNQHKEAMDKIRTKAMIEKDVSMETRIMKAISLLRIKRDEFEWNKRMKTD